uniref:Uncharacterized protein n=1 Tax=Anguilla anguilla TaxID=7936 RepID=A0A0E9RXU7_ANGAN
MLSFQIWAFCYFQINGPIYQCNTSLHLDGHLEQWHCLDWDMMLGVWSISEWCISQHPCSAVKK